METRCCMPDDHVNTVFGLIQGLCKELSVLILSSEVGLDLPKRERLSVPLSTQLHIGWSCPACCTREN